MDRFKRGHKLTRTHYETDEETSFSVLNVRCTIYPTGAEREQFRHVADAMRELLRKYPG